MRLPLISALAILGPALLAGPARADWRYCLARAPQQVVYVSPAFRSVDAVDRIGAAFARRLDGDHHAHDPVQCPRADEAGPLRAMRLSALRFNREDGFAIVELDWAPDAASHSAEVRP
ncbi:hypothetical protein [Methylobacterium sp. JK268]